MNKYTYQEREQRFNEEKKALSSKNLSPKEYEQSVKRLADKWKI